MNILIVKTSAIGDVTHVMPALHCLRVHYPESHITWLVEEAASDLVVGHPAVDRVLVSKRQKWVKEFRAGHWLAAIRKFSHFVGLVRERQYDLVIDFQGLLKSGLWVFISGGKRRVGFGKGMQHEECSYVFLNERVPAVDMEIHALDRGLILLKEIGVPCGEVVFDVPVAASHTLHIQGVLGEAGFQVHTPLVAINPQTTWSTKLWYPERFAAVADALAAQGCFIVFTGGKTDRDVIQHIQGAMAHSSLDLSGRTSLKELAALYQQADVILSTDTGPMHIAASVSTPVVALFGPTAPWRTGPYGDQHTVLRSGISCSPCFKRKCPLEPEKQCMADISVAQVVDAALALLAGSLDSERAEHG